MLKQEFHSKQFEMHSDHSSHKNNHNKNKNSLLPSMFPNPPDDLEISLIPADANDGEVGRVCELDCVFDKDAFCFKGV